jgi:hypothetical protein
MPRIHEPVSWRGSRRGTAVATVWNRGGACLNLRSKVVGVPKAMQGILTGQLITMDGERSLVSFGGRRWEF